MSSALLLGVVLADFFASGCRQRDVCEDVAGPCLAVRVTGPSLPGMYDELQTSLQLDTASPVRTGSTTGDIDLPLTLRVLPPDGVLPSAVHTVRVTGLLSSVAVATAQTGADFAWADDQHLTVTLELDPPTSTGPDGSTGTDGGLPPVDLSSPPSTDMAQPPLPTLKWLAEANDGGRNELLHVWTGAAPKVWTAGAAGTVLARQTAGNWTAETTNIPNDLYGLFGIPGGSVWAVGASPGAWRRDDASGKWAADQAGLNIGAQGTVWSVVTGAAAGELWAGADGGLVWHRTGSASAAGSWQSEQALPAGMTVFSVAYADGAVFAVGQRGYVAVRKDTGSGARWQSAFQYTALAGMTGTRDNGLYGVFGFDRDTAVAVGSKGLLVRYVGGTWQPMPQTIDANANEFNGVWATAPGRVWAVGYNGLIIRVEGTTLTQLHMDTNQNLYGIFGRSEADIYVVGSSFGPFSLILHGTP